jgi:hypothetical protein
MQKDIAKQLDVIRNYEDPHETLLSGRHPYFSNMALDPAPLSPRQVSHDERRPSLHALPRQNFFKPPLPSQFNSSPRRYGSIGTANPSPNFHRIVQPQPPPPPQLHHPPSQHPLAHVSSPPGANLGRRHTSADIRVPAWPGQSGSPFASGQSSSHWPSSPKPNDNGVDPHVQNALSQYEFGAPRQSFSSQQTTPPLTSDTTPSTLSVESNWSLGASRFPPRLLDSAPQTRRSSMASNVHSLLNPAETIERDEDDGMSDDRKRKRLQ